MKSCSNDTKGKLKQSHTTTFIQGFKIVFYTLIQLQKTEVLTEKMLIGLNGTWLVLIQQPQTQQPCIHQMWALMIWKLHQLVMFILSICRYVFVGRGSNGAGIQGIH